MFGNLLYIWTIYTVLWYYIPWPPTATTHRQFQIIISDGSRQESDFKYASHDTCPYESNPSHHTIVNSDARTGMMPSGMMFVSGHNGYSAVVVPANETSFSKPGQESERTSTHGHDTTNMLQGIGLPHEIIVHLRGFFTQEAMVVQLRGLFIGEMAAHALRSVFTTGNMPFDVLFAVLKKLAIEYDTQLHKGINMDENALNGIPTVIGREMLCYTICKQLCPRARVSTACRMPCRLALDAAFPSVTSTVS